MKQIHKNTSRNTKSTKSTKRTPTKKPIIIQLKPFDSGSRTASSALDRMGEEARRRAQLAIKCAEQEHARFKKEELPMLKAQWAQQAHKRFLKEELPILKAQWAQQELQRVDESERQRTRFLRLLQEPIPDSERQLFKLLQLNSADPTPKKAGRKTEEEKHKTRKELVESVAQEIKPYFNDKVQWYYKVGEYAQRIARTPEDAEKLLLRLARCDNPKAFAKHVVAYTKKIGLRTIMRSLKRQ